MPGCSTCVIQQCLQLPLQQSGAQNSLVKSSLQYIPVHANWANSLWIGLGWVGLGPKNPGIVSRHKSFQVNVILMWLPADIVQGMSGQHVYSM